MPVFMAIFFNSLGSGQNVTVTNSPDPIVIQALGSVASLVEEPCAPEKKMENDSRWDRYLGMTAAMTQVPVPMAIALT